MVVSPTAAALELESPSVMGRSKKKIDLEAAEYLRKKKIEDERERLRKEQERLEREEEEARLRALEEEEEASSSPSDTTESEEEMVFGRGQRRNNRGRRMRGNNRRRGGNRLKNKFSGSRKNSKPWAKSRAGKMRSPKFGTSPKHGKIGGSAASKNAAKGAGRRSKFAQDPRNMKRRATGFEMNRGLDENSKKFGNKKKSIPRFMQQKSRDEIEKKRAELAKKLEEEEMKECYGVPKITKRRPSSFLDRFNEKWGSGGATLDDIDENGLINGIHPSLLMPHLNLGARGAPRQRRASVAIATNPKKKEEEKKQKKKKRPKPKVSWMRDQKCDTLRQDVGENARVAESKQIEDIVGTEMAEDDIRRTELLGAVRSKPLKGVMKQLEEDQKMILDVFALPSLESQTANEMLKTYRERMKEEETSHEREVRLAEEAAAKKDPHIVDRALNEIDNVDAVSVLRSWLEQDAVFRKMFFQVAHSNAAGRCERKVSEILSRMRASAKGEKWKANDPIKARQLDELISGLAEPRHVREQQRADVQPSRLFMHNKVSDWNTLKPQPWE